MFVLTEVRRSNIRVTGFIFKGKPAQPYLALSLLMLGVFANYHYLSLALNDLALFAHGLYGRFYFHN